MTSISIAMCTYNGATYLPDQLRSILDQTVAPDEMVVCDDGSTDATLEILSTFAQRAPFPVKIVRNDRTLHYTGNFLKAASLCHSSYVAFCDQDDVWHQDKLETVLERIDQTRPSLLLHEGRVVDREAVPTGLKVPDLAHLVAAPDRPPFTHGAKGFAMIIHHEIVKEVLAGWDWDLYVEHVARHGAPFGHDLLFYAWCLGREVELVMRPLVDYRIHDANVTATMTYLESGWRRWRTVLRGIQISDFNYGSAASAWAAQVVLIDAMFEDQPRGLRLLRDYLDERARLWQLRADVHDRERRRRSRGAALKTFLRFNRNLRLAEPFGARAFVKDAVLIVATPSRRSELISHGPGN
jgi:glycosyltransferase involved in cell wall biosynthesis